MADWCDISFWCGYGAAALLVLVIFGMGVLEIRDLIREAIDKMQRGSDDWE